MTRWIVVLLAAVCSSACSHDGGSDPADEVKGLAENFLADMSVGAWNAAFSRLHPDLQTSCGSAERLERVVEGAGERPQSWTLREPSVRKYTGLITGSVEKADGTPGIVEFSMDLSDGGWRIWAWSASNRELCLEQDD